MIKGKTKEPVEAFPGGYINGQWYKYYNDYRLAKDLFDEKTRKRKLVNHEMYLLGNQINELLVEKKELDERMKKYTDLKVVELSSIIEEYELQIQKLELAIQLCKKSLNMTRREHNAQFKLDNPPNPLLKTLQVKLHNLQKKLYKI